jgi:predicted GNAT family acetyltransferase
MMISSHFAKYVKEREGFDVIENATGYFEYKINGDECYIRTMYIDEKYRSQGCAKDFAEKVISIAKEAGCKFITGTVVPSLNPSMATESLAMQIKFGFKVSSSHEDLIILRKEI